MTTKNGLKGAGDEEKKGGRLKEKNPPEGEKNIGVAKKILSYPIFKKIREVFRPLFLFYIF